MQHIASRLFSDDDKKRINDAVAEAESKTSAEIVPVVATSSGRYDRAEDVIGLWVAVAALTATWFLVPDTSSESGNWAGPWPHTKLVLLVAAVVVGFIAGAVLGAWIHPLRQLFSPRKQMQDEVAARARGVFFDSSVHHTAGGTGLLIYISLFERTAAVLADQEIIDKLGQSTVDELCAQLTREIGDGDITAALCDTLKAAGEKLGEVLPRADDDVNELPDTLVTLD